MTRIVAISAGLSDPSTTRMLADRLVESAQQQSGDVSVEVGFALTEPEAQSFLAHLAGEKLKLFYIKLPLEMGVVGGEP
jgi:NAD(P)H-dependent FMN reductase